MGAGLGGGSADGAFTLLAINQKFDLGLTTDELLDYALQLGSDCPFFIINQPAMGTGRGEVLVPVNLNLSNFQLVIVNPGIHIDTGWAFSQLAPLPQNALGRPPLQNILTRSVEEWKGILTNDFEKPVFTRYPQIQLIRDSFYNNGATFSSMSGSGSSVYALFYKNVKPFTHFPPHYIIKQQYL
jgi:4-diphosphocytidyl-2-C-methyl-D-erythritol kinase